jgi:hypothetical protein
MKAKSIKGATPSEFKSALQKSATDGFFPTIALVFLSYKQDRKSVYDMFHNKGIDVLGATSSGEFIDGHHNQHF